ncbi:MAG TPA: response regulator, partial [Terriglobales bacterium]
PALVEFISEAIAVLESDLILISETAAENEEDFAAFKTRYSFAFAAPAAPQPAARSSESDAPQTYAYESAPQQDPAPAFADPGFEDGVEIAVSLNAGLSDEGIIAQTDLEESIEGNLPLGDLGVEPEKSADTSTQPEAAELDIPDLEPDGDVPAEILEFFVPEAEEHLQIAQASMLALETAPNPEEINKLFRALHTIKGSAAQVGFQRISRMAHSAEDLVGKLRDGELPVGTQAIDLCLEATDAIKKFLYNQWTDEAQIQSTAKSLFSRIAAVASAPAPVEPASQPEPTRATAEVGKIVAAASEADQVGAHEGEELVSALAKKEVSALPQSKSVRIALDRLDSMMNAVGELVINRTRMLGRLTELEQLADVLNFSKGRMQDKISEFQEKHEFSRINMQRSYHTQRAPQHPRFDNPRFDTFGYPLTPEMPVAADDFSELEMDRYDDFNILSRSLTEISADISEVLTQLDTFVRRVDSDIDEFTKLAHRLQDEITQSRMVQIGNLYTRISRSVRDAAKASGKAVDVTLHGERTELDNSIIQQIADPLLHLVRNSVAHGIESAEERYEAGKSDVGNIAVRAYHRGNHIFIEVEDDGRGIDYDAVRKRAIDRKLISAAEAERLSEPQLLEFLFHPGFSTAERKTELAGRGVGLDVVRANLNALNGEIEIDTQKGLGTRFTLKVPLTLIISQALFVRCSGDTFAFPLSFVEEIRRIKAEEIEEVGGKLLTKVRDVVTEVIRLDQQLGLPEMQPINGFFRLVIVNAGGRQVGIVVDDILRKDEIVIKNLGAYLKSIKLFPGATIAPDGSLILLVDVNRLITGETVERKPLMTGLNAVARLFAPGTSAVAKGTLPAQVIEPVVEKVVILADDSISVRKYVGKMLEKAGFRVRLAADGLEAYEIATSTPCDLIITDLEMPRTNGYELLTMLRQTAETRKVPVMVVTSRAGSKHRERAMKEGASHFMTKPVQEEYFVAAVEDMIGPAKPERMALYAAR